MYFAVNNCLRKEMHSEQAYVNRKLPRGIANQDYGQYRTKNTPLDKLTIIQ